MAVFTNVAEGDLRRFLQDYAIGSLCSYRGIVEGVQNSNFLLHTQAGRFILTLYENGVEKHDLPFFLGLTQHLNERGVVCPWPISRKDGSIVGELAGRPAAIISFLEGSWTPKPLLNHCAQVGAMLARLHLAARDFPLTRENALSLTNWQELWDNCRARADEVQSGWQKDIGAELVFLKAHWPQGLPSGVIHADLFIDNVFFQADHIVGVIDFYFACNDAWAYDIAVCLNAWCFEADGVYNRQKARALIENYCKVRSLEAEEKAFLPVLVRGASMRFLLTRLYDWFHTPHGRLVVKKDPREYWQKLSFFRKACQDDLGLWP
ncbi:homoserine kinase [Bartonella sp. DGB2]|uniref:homoserine kinase n=1 Tax=Bartonella sp. DGB2 TaxID=3388426 RepID=UPI00399010BC